MKKLGIAIGIAACASGVLAWFSSGNGIAGPASSSAPSTAPSAAPSASAAATPKPEARVPLASLTIPSEKSPLPKAAEWEHATPVSLARRNQTSCSTSMLREYVKVTCPITLLGIRQFVGPIEDVELAVVPKNDIQTFWSEPIGGHIVFPLRRGKSYVFRFFGAESGYEGGAFATDGPLVDVAWPEGDAAPTVTLR